MTVIIDGTTGISAVQAGAVEQSDLAANVVGNGPAFSAYNSTAQTFADSTYTKVTFDVEEFDTNNNFASSRFTPTVAGYYSITAYLGLSPTVEALSSLYKNGSQYKRFTYNTTSAGTTEWGGTVSSIYMNGTTDYLEFYMFQSSAGTSKNSNGTQQTTYINGCMTRAA